MVSRFPRQLNQPRRYRDGIRYLKSLAKTDERDVGISSAAAAALEPAFGDLPEDSGAEPACLCIPPTPWSQRRKDKDWADDLGQQLESRTCLCCAATNSMLVNP